MFLCILYTKYLVFLVLFLLDFVYFVLDFFVTMCYNIIMVRETKQTLSNKI
nr:MAG TPA: hypothetical protein [Caudoviricetes sp.]